MTKELQQVSVLLVQLSGGAEGSKIGGHGRRRRGRRSGAEAWRPGRRIWGDRVSELSKWDLPRIGIAPEESQFVGSGSIYFGSGSGLQLQTTGPQYRPQGLGPSLGFDYRPRDFNPHKKRSELQSPHSSHWPPISPHFQPGRHAGWQHVVPGPYRIVFLACFYGRACQGAGVAMQCNTVTWGGCAHVVDPVSTRC
jgi:hypothetical protein